MAYINSSRLIFFCIQDISRYYCKVKDLRRGIYLNLNKKEIVLQNFQEISSK